MKQNEFEGNQSFPCFSTLPFVKYFINIAVMSACLLQAMSGIVCFRAVRYLQLVRFF